MEIRRVTKVLRYSFLAAVSAALLSCNHQGPVQPPSDNDPVWLDNPSASDEVTFHWIQLDNLISMTENSNYRIMYGSGVPESYHFMISSGLLPVIFRNRYSGEDVANTLVYSPGDIYFQLDRERNILHFYEHQGPLDAVFDPEAVPFGETRPWAGNSWITTNGYSLFRDSHINPAYYGAIDPQTEREHWNIPGNDDARARMYILYSFMNRIMSDACYSLPAVPMTMDGYVNLIGRANPIAWTNPYTAQPMREVGWADTVDMWWYSYVTEDPRVKAWVVINPGQADPSLAGNYAFAVGTSTIAPGEFEAFALFYFLEPDGSLAAYLAKGFGPIERRGYPITPQHTGTDTRDD